MITSGDSPDEMPVAGAGAKPVERLTPLRRVVRAYRDDIGPAQRSALLSWGAFTTTFAAVRGVTYSIRYGVGPLRNVTLGGEHIHHYVWGIATLAAVGGVAVHGEESNRRHPAVAVAYGAGLALIVDEFALLLDLQDVYWARQGRQSVDVAVSLIAAVGSYFAATPFWHRLLSARDR